MNESLMELLCRFMPVFWLADSITTEIQTLQYPNQKNASTRQTDRKKNMMSILCATIRQNLTFIASLLYFLFHVRLQLALYTGEEKAFIT